MEWVLWWVLVVVSVAVAAARPWTDETETETDDGTNGESSGGSGAPLPAHGIGVYAHEDGIASTTDPGRCEACGTDNDPFYTYCRSCVAPLS